MRFSVISVCWNYLDGVKTTTPSILAQKFKDFEWIIVDGNSTDGTRQWLTEQKLDYLRLVTIDKWGLFESMNKGLDHVKGDYFIFMNCGDEFYDDDVLSRIDKTITSAGEPPGFIYGDSIDIAPDKTRYYQKAKDYKKMWRGFFAHHIAMYYHTASFNGRRYGDDYKYCGDYALLCDLLMGFEAKGKNIVKVDFPVCIFEMGGWSDTTRKKSLFDDYRIRKNILKLWWPLPELLFVLHYGDMYFKKYFPRVARGIRLKKIKNKK
ncbi:MAG: glycosyltransferase [Candidatus Omnitrophica bacterium]|nr:glycosyltransferase [Candidatus Omnitrophota bacterium]